jgi:hypothetical protein
MNDDIELISDGDAWRSSAIRWSSIVEGLSSEDLG